jgi:hypothetical protein
MLTILKKLLNDNLSFIFNKFEDENLKFGDNDNDL